MESGRALSLLAILALSCSMVDSVVFTRCQLTRELLKLSYSAFSRTYMSNWVCLAEKVSERNTSALVVKSPRKKFYGIFQIGSEYCKEGRKGGICEITCESLLNDNVADDAACAQQVFTMEGFKYWSKWETRCKGQTLPDIEKCPDWQHPPSRVSPGRDRRTISSRYSRQFKFVPYKRINTPIY